MSEDLYRFAWGVWAGLRDLKRLCAHRMDVAQTIDEALERVEYILKVIEERVDKDSKDVI